MARKKGGGTLSIRFGINYFDDLRSRLEEYGITQRALAEELKMPESAVSRWFRLSVNTGKPLDPNFSTVSAIEMAIVRIRKKHAAAERRRLRLQK